MQSIEATRDFVEYCGGRGLDPEETLAFLVSQDWKGAKDNEANVGQCTGCIPEYTDDPDDQPADHEENVQSIRGSIPIYTDDMDNGE